VVEVTGVHHDGTLKRRQADNKVHDLLEAPFVTPVQVCAAADTFGGLFHGRVNETAGLHGLLELFMRLTGDQRQHVTERNGRGPVMPGACQELLIVGVTVAGGRTAHGGQGTVTGFDVEDVAGEAVHPGQGVDRDLLGVLFGVLDLLEDFVACNLGVEHFVLGFLTAGNARFNELGRRRLEDLRVLVADHRRRQDTVGIGHGTDVGQHGHFITDPVTWALLLEHQHVRITQWKLAPTREGLLKERQALVLRLAGHPVQEQGILVEISLQQVEVPLVLGLLQYEWIFHGSMTLVEAKRNKVGVAHIRATLRFY
jgi:hypothetical protein